MPREQIVNAQSIEHPAVEGTEEHPPSEAHTEVKWGLGVGWNRMGWVQMFMMPPDWNDTGDWRIVDLDRAAINSAIRALRKARDSAYGRDE